MTDFNKSPKPQITLCIGVFFDGTGHNANNFKIGEVQVSDASSYVNYLTNIYLLEQLYSKDNKCLNQQRQISIYIEGVGTSNGGKDDMLAMSTGLGETGIIGKVQQAIALIKLRIEDLSQGQLDKDVFFSRVINFDIFGFSRGAAAARHLANMIFDNEQKICTVLQHSSIATKFTGEIYAKTRFLGLFDTVAAIAIPNNGFNPHSNNSGEVRLDLRPCIAEKVFHIAALNECRFNFPLSSVKPNWPQVFLPGTHSDIGGGYYPLEHENLYLTRPLFETVSISTPDDKTAVFHETNEIFKLMHTFPAVSPLLKKENVCIKTWNDPRMPTDRYGIMQKRSGAAVVLERTVFNDWSKVALLMMLDAAQDAGVMFNYNPDYFPDFNAKNELKELCDKAIRIGRAVRNGECPEQFSEQEILKLAYKYIHCSANWNTVIKDEKGHIKGAVRISKILSFINRPDENWSRTIYSE